MRLFVAVWPPAEVVATLAALPRPDVAGLRWTSAHQWHVTLRFLGEADPDDAVRALRGADRVGDASVGLGPVTGRFGRRVLHVPARGLEAAAASVAAATRGVGQAPPDRPFTGHVTLARARDRRGVDLRPLSGVPVQARWTATELRLVASHLGGRGPARYEVVEAFALGADGP
ncbi:MAG TPA: RNA 2',3'-cyclic phosphodiesterase [Acidimicrobiales bacterium]|nr:RNA 2',3'-cyclic phosphodiesterase [Acidimicrobiales bacterium]